MGFPAAPAGFATVLLAVAAAVQLTERGERAFRGALTFLSLICCLCLALAGPAIPRLLPAASTAALFSGWLASGASATWQSDDASTGATALLLTAAASTVLLLAILAEHPRGSVRTGGASPAPTWMFAAVLGSLLSLATLASTFAGAHAARLAQRTEASRIPEVQRDAASLCVFSSCSSALCQLAMVLAARGSGRTVAGVLTAASVFQMSACALGLGASLALASSETPFLLVQITLGAQGLFLVVLSASAHAKDSGGL